MSQTSAQKRVSTVDSVVHYLLIICESIAIISCLEIGVSPCIKE